MPTRREPTLGELDVAFDAVESRRLDQAPANARSADWPGRVFVLLFGLLLPVGFVAWAWSTDAFAWSADPDVPAWKRALVSAGYLVVSAVQLAAAVLAFGQSIIAGVLSLVVPFRYVFVLRQSGVYPVFLLVLIAGLAATVIGTLALR